MAYSISLHLVLLAVGVILLQTLLVDPPTMVEAYTTFEISKHCQRHQPSRKEREKFTQDFGKLSRQIESKYGLIVPDADTDGAGEDGDDDGRLQVSKSIIVDNVADESAVRIVLSADEASRERQHNWQRCSLFVAAKKPNGLIVTIRKLHLRSGIDWLRLLINNGSFVREFSHVKIDDERDSVAYVANHGVLIELLTGYSALSPPEEIEVELILTNFREADLCLIEQEFDCGSFRCISSVYQCDGVNNCGDSRDEAGCPIDNITNYIIISLLILLAGAFTILCFCYRCCCQSGKQSGGRRNAYSNRAKQYQYVKIRTSSLAAPNGIIKRRTSSIASESDAIGELRPGNVGAGGGGRIRYNSIATSDSALRRFKLTHMADSMPVLVPSAPQQSLEGAKYGSTDSTYMHLPYHTYATVQLGPSGYGLIPAHHIFAPSTSRVAHYSPPSGTNGRQAAAAGTAQSSAETVTGDQLGTFPRRTRQPSYPVLHPNLFTPLSPPQPSTAPPPYTPPTYTSLTAPESSQQPQETENSPKQPPTTN